MTIPDYIVTDKGVLAVRHPFDGINTPTQTRRSWLGRALAALGGLFLGSRLFAVAPPRKTVGDDTNPEPPAKPTEAKKEEGKALTRALNENGAVTKALNENGRLTRALNENGQKMTLALRENGGGITTLALGEEGGKQ